MIKHSFFTYAFLIALLFFMGCDQTIDSSGKAKVDKTDFVNYVNPLMGTDSEFSLSNGNTYPAIATPWAMNFWSPQTSKMGDGWMYKYDEHKLRGIKQTHQPSPWINDYAAFSLMAVTGKLKFEENERASWFSHKAEKVQPHYYSVYLADYDTSVEISPTDRSSHFRFTFPERDSSFIIIDAFEKGSMVKIIPEERKVIGYSRYNHGGVPDNFHNYWVATFDKDFEEFHTWSDGWELNRNQAESMSDHSGAILRFKTKAGEQIHVKVASSFISHEQAMLNLEREIGNDDFQTTKTKAFNSWNKELSKIQVEDPNIDNVRTFYSCLYRVLLFPRKFHEINAQNEIVHYSPYNGEVLPGYMFTDNGFWDTFRAVFPFFTLMYPDLNTQIMEGLANTYKESGWLPEWASPGHRGAMIGSNSAVNIADSYVKGIRGYDIETLYEAVVKNATTAEGRPLDNNGNVVGSVGREGVDYYNKLGYVPYDVGIHENAARTLEYAFADFNISQIAKILGKKDDELLYSERANNYKKLFDPSTGWMRGKNEDGQFQTPFNPLKWGDAFTEGNSLHYTWSVFQDIQGLIDLMGGDLAFEKKLDNVFEMPPVFDDSYYGFTIHEIREMQIVNMGNYAHGNQPIQHMIYLYNYCKKPWKTQEKIREVLTKLYAPTPDGYCGDEDNGQTSAWYVFSALGFYPVTPGTTQYVLGSPLFEKATMFLENGNKFSIQAKNNGEGLHFIQNAKLNAKEYNQNWIDHHRILDGGELLFEMGNTPNENWGSSDVSVPFSMTSRKEQ